ncbi:MAG: P-loop NTPase [Ignisphaera sp.]
MLPHISIGNIGNVLLVMSGKGGVGKSFVSASIAIALKELGFSVALLDADIHGPSIPWILGIENTFLGVTVEGKLIPVEVNGIAVVSFELLLEHKEEPIAWRGPLKTRAIVEILSKTIWGSRDFLIVDMPPGVGDEHLTIVHILKPWIKGAILVLTPGRLVAHIVKKARKFLSEANVKLLGAILNMAYFQCPSCGEIHKLYGIYGFEDLRILMEIPIKPELSQAIGEGRLIQYLYNDDRELLKKFIDVCKEILK